MKNATFSTSALTTSVSEINWTEVGQTTKVIAYRAAVAIGLVCYLTFIAARMAINAGHAAKTLWVKYQIGQKLLTIIEAIKFELSGLPALSDRIEEVKDAYSLAASKTLLLIESVKNDAIASANAITGTEVSEQEQA